MVDRNRQRTSGICLANCTRRVLFCWCARTFLRLSGAPAPQPTQGFPAAQAAAGISDLPSNGSSLQMAPCKSVSAGNGWGAVILHERKCIILADEMEERKKKHRHVCLRTFSLGAVMDERARCRVCVCLSPRCKVTGGTGANRKRACPQTNEQHYSNGVFVVSAVCCGSERCCHRQRLTRPRTGDITVPRHVLDLTVLLQFGLINDPFVKKKKSNTWSGCVCSAAASEGFRQKSGGGLPSEGARHGVSAGSNSRWALSKSHTHTKKPDCKTPNVNKWRSFTHFVDHTAESNGKKMRGAFKVFTS